MLNNPRIIRRIPANITTAIERFTWKGDCAVSLKKDGENWRVVLNSSARYFYIRNWEYQFQLWYNPENHHVAFVNGSGSGEIEEQDIRLFVLPIFYYWVDKINDYIDALVGEGKI